MLLFSFRVIQHAFLGLILWEKGVPSNFGKKFSGTSSGHLHLFVVLTSESRLLKSWRDNMSSDTVFFCDLYGSNDFE